MQIVSTGLFVFGFVMLGVSAVFALRAAYYYGRASVWRELSTED